MQSSQWQRSNGNCCTQKYQNQTRPTFAMTQSRQFCGFRKIAIDIVGFRDETGLCLSVEQSPATPRVRLPTTVSWVEVAEGADKAPLSSPQTSRRWRGGRCKGRWEDSTRSQCERMQFWRRAFPLIDIHSWRIHQGDLGTTAKKGCSLKMLSDTKIYGKFWAHQELTDIGECKNGFSWLKSSQKNAIAR